MKEYIPISIFSAKSQFLLKEEIPLLLKETILYFDLENTNLLQRDKFTFNKQDVISLFEDFKINYLFHNQLFEKKLLYNFVQGNYNFNEQIKIETFNGISEAIDFKNWVLPYINYQIKKITFYQLNGISKDFYLNSNVYFLHSNKSILSFEYNEELKDLLMNHLLDLKEKYFNKKQFALDEELLLQDLDNAKHYFILKVFNNIEIKKEYVSILYNLIFTIFEYCGNNIDNVPDSFRTSITKISNDILPFLSHEKKEIISKNLNTLKSATQFDHVKSIGFYLVILFLLILFITTLLK